LSSSVTNPKAQAFLNFSGLVIALLHSFTLYTYSDHSSPVTVKWNLSQGAGLSFSYLLCQPKGEHIGELGTPDDLGPFGYPACIAIFAVNLSDPAGISIAGRAYADLGMEGAEVKGGGVGLRHVFILVEKEGFPKVRGKGHVRIC
jgi:hypothetical protein